MDGPSRGSWAAAQTTLNEVLPGVDARALAGELFALSEAVNATAKLRRALADSSRDGYPKRELARRLFAERISAGAMSVLESAVSGRWTSDRDLIDALERLGIDAVLAAAEKDGVLDNVEDELFRFERLVSSNSALARALGKRDAEARKKAELVVRLLAGKAKPDTVWLAQRPVLHPRGRKYAAAIWAQLRIAARRREQINAIVTSARELEPQQRERLSAGLAKMYGRSVFVNVVVDPAVLGGLLVQIGDDVIDGTVRRRLEDVRRTMGT